MGDCNMTAWLIRAIECASSIKDMTLNSDGEVPVLGLWGMWSIPSLPVLSGSLWPRVIISVRVPSMGQIKLSNHLLYLKSFNCANKWTPDSFRNNVTYKLFIYKYIYIYIYIYIYVCVCDLTLNNHQGLICH